MKLINISEGPVFLEDVGQIIPSDTKFTVHDIPDFNARTSKALKYALSSMLLVDVTGKEYTKADIFGWKQQFKKLREDSSKPSPSNSPFMAKKSLLVTDDHSAHATVKTEPEHVSSLAEYAKSMEEDKKALSVVYSGPARDGGGYARMNRKFMFGLQDRGVNVRYDPVPSFDDMDPETSLKLNKLQTARVTPSAIKIYGQTAPLIWDWARYRMLFTMMETRRLHPMYVDRCNSADEIVVPTKWCYEAFAESGVKRPMSVVPLGIDEKIYHEDAEPISFSFPLKDYVFLSVFGWSLRKGYDVLIRAYMEEFTSDDPVTLLISSRFFGATDESKKKKIREDFAKVSRQVKNPKKPQVVLYGDVLPDEMMPRLYAASDCYVLISRGEGFGLPYCEAAACGIPVIGSRYSGQTDFLTDDNSYLVDVDGFGKADPSLSCISQFYEDAEFPIFGPKAVEQTRYFMRRAFENRDEANMKAQKLKDLILSNYTWDKCTDCLLEKIKETYSRIGVKK